MLANMMIDNSLRSISYFWLLSLLELVMRPGILLEWDQELENVASSRLA